MSEFSGCIGRLAAKLYRLGRSAALSFLLAALLAGPTMAQELSASERAQLEARKQALFDRMLRQPGDLDTTFAYADISAKLGDNEAAVSALERMLLFNPNLPRVQLELGALYFRMGSYEISRTYFEKALAAGPPAEVKSRIETYLAEIARLSSPQRFAGFLFFGAQYQSDANVAPGSPLIHSPFGDVLLNSQFVKKADVNLFGTGAMQYNIDLGNQDRDTFEIGGTGFGNHYFSVSRLDLGLVELTAGPRLNFPQAFPGVTGLSLKPYAILNDVSLGGNQYFHTYGAGGEATSAWQGVRFKSVLEFREKNFNNAADRPLSRGLNGNDTLVSLFATKPITTTPLSELNLEFDFLNQETRLKYFSNQSFAVAAAYRIRIDDPTGLTTYPWETTLFLGRSWANYNAPDPCCINAAGGFNTRLDRRWRFGLTQSFQFRENLALIVQLQRDIVSSNLPLYRYTSNSVLIGPQLRF